MSAMRGLKPVSKVTGLIRFNIANTKPQIKLFRDCCRELPRIMTIFDLDIPIVDLRSKIGNLIRENAHVKDDRVIRMLVAKGYMELEETCLQYKTKHQLLNKLDPVSLRKHEIPDEDDEIAAFLKGT